MRRLYREMARLSEQGESFAVATIFDKVGSAPRSAGAKMVVRADGSIFGTIGGGRLEADAVRLAKEAIARQTHARPRIRPDRQGRRRDGHDLRRRGRSADRIRRRE